MSRAEGGDSSGMDDLSEDDSPLPKDKSKEQVPKSPRLRAYPNDSTGPWVVYFQPKKKPLNVVQIADDLTKRFSAVTEITKVRHNKLRVVVSNLKQANEIAVSQFFTLEYRVYIPARDVEIEGVVTESSLNSEILQKQAVGRFKNPLLPAAKILDVQQLGSVSLSEGKKSFTPTDSFRVTFSGSALPHYIELGKLRLPVRLFVPRVMNCQNCKQLGHTASHCGSKARCSKCGDKHEDGTCADTEPKCVFCKGTPPHDLSSCPVYKQRGEKLERSLKERSRQSFAEMLKKATPTTINQNPFAILSDDESDSDLAEEGTPFSFPESSSRKRRRIRSRKVADQESQISLPKSRSGGKKDSSTPPGFRKYDFNQNFPPLPGTSKTPDAPILRTEAPTSTGLFSFDNIVDGILKFLDISDPLKSIVLAMLPSVKTLLKQLTLKWPIIATFISFDG